MTSKTKVLSVADASTAQQAKVVVSQRHERVYDDAHAISAQIKDGEVLVYIGAVCEPGQIRLYGAAISLPKASAKAFAEKLIALAS